MREKLGFSKREPFAEALGLTEPMVGYYERGDRVPDATALAPYRERFGVNLTWVITGDGDMFDHAPAKTPTTAPAAGVDIVLLQKIGDRVHAIFVECKQHPPSRSMLNEAGQIYNQLLSTVPDIGDEQMVNAVLPVLLERFKQRISTAEPGTGKRSAS